jgi:acyl carrier protein
MPTKEEVFGKVKEALVDALGVDDDEVEPGATMVGDLGAESIDFLDIIFKLEKAFNFQFKREDLYPEDILANSKFVQSGRLTADGVVALKARMPFADLSKFEKNPVIQDFNNLLTVQDLCNYVSMKIGA